MPRAPAAGNPWLWSADPPALGGVTEALLKKGFHVAWIDVDDLYGNQEALAHWDAFYDWAVKEHRLSSKPVLVCTEEHALVTFNWAAGHLDTIACIFAQNPWLDFKDGQEAESPVCKKIREAHKQDSNAETVPFAAAPLRTAAQFGKAETPMLLLHTGQESSSPQRQQVDQFYKDYRLAGRGPFEAILIPEDAVPVDGLTLHTLYFILGNTSHLPSATPGKPLPEAPEWTIADFSGTAGIYVLDDVVIIETGNDMSGVLWRGDVPKMDYEITLEAMRLSGNDFFCGLTAPWEETAFSLILGGWGGTCIGISSLDWLDAYNNETATFRSLLPHRWYPVKLRVTGGRIQAWVDREQLVDVEIGDREVDIRWEMAPVKPLGIATWRTTGAFRKFRLISLSPLEIPE